MDNDPTPLPNRAGAVAENEPCSSFLVTMDIIGRRWNAIIIKAIAEQCTGFAEIRRFVGHIGDTMLAKRLRELESDGLIERHIIDTRPLRVKYTLTEAGLALLPILSEITRWGRAYARVEAADHAASSVCV